MKSSILLLGLIGFVLTSRSYAQEIGYKELIGTWNTSDPFKEKVIFKFLDTSVVVIQDSKEGSSKLSYRLISDSVKGRYTISFEFSTEGISYVSNYILRRMNANTLKLVNLDTYDPIVQRPQELKERAFYIVKTNL